MEAEKRGLALILPIVVAVFIGMVIVTGWLLLTDYRPNVGGDGVLEWEPPPSIAWFRMQLGVLAGTGVAVAIRFRHRPRSLAAAVVGAIAAAVAGVLCPLVMWDQVGLHAVTVGADVRGLLWPLTHGDQVRFLIIDGAEVGVATYQRWLLVNIVAVVVACVALLVSVWPSPPDQGIQDQLELAAPLD